MLSREGCHLVSPIVLDREGLYVFGHFYFKSGKSIPPCALSCFDLGGVLSSMGVLSCVVYRSFLYRAL